MSASSGGHFHQSWQSPVSSSTDTTPTNLPSSSSRRLEECVLPPTPPYVRHEDLHSATSVKFPLRKCDKWWRVRLSIAALDSVPTFIQRELVDVTPTVRDASGSRLCWWHLTAYLHSVQPMNVCAPVNTVRYLSLAPGYDPLVVGTWSSRALEVCALVCGASVCQRQLYQTNYCPTSRTLTPVVVLVDIGLHSRLIATVRK